MGEIKFCLTVYCMFFLVTMTHLRNQLSTMHSNAKRLFCYYCGMFLYFFSAIFKSVKEIAAKIPANGHVESGLIIDFNCKIYIRRANIIDASATVILIIIQKRLSLGIRFHAVLRLLIYKHIKALPQFHSLNQLTLFYEKGRLEYHIL